MCLAFSWKNNRVQTNEVSVLNYLQYLKRLGKSYSAINTHKSMLIQTLKLLKHSLCDNPFYIPRFMKGLFNTRPPTPRYPSCWDMSVVLEYLKTLFHLESMDLNCCYCVGV